MGLGHHRATCVGPGHHRVTWVGLVSSQGHLDGPRSSQGHLVGPGHHRVTWWAQVITRSLGWAPGHHRVTWWAQAITESSQERGRRLQSYRGTEMTEQGSQGQGAQMVWAGGFAVEGGPTGRGRQSLQVLETRGNPFLPEPPGEASPAHPLPELRNNKRVLSRH